MKRRSANPVREAILIGCPGENENYLYGVSHDLLNLANFLQSAEGGLWSRHETYRLWNPSKARLSEVMGLVRSDYLIIYFSGHGYMQNGTQYLCVADGEISEELLISKHNPRQLIIQDACREFAPSPTLKGYVPYGDIVELFEGLPTRVLLDQHIDASDKGVTIAYATGIGSAARDTGKGGWFTDRLLDQSRNLAPDGSNYTSHSIEKLIRSIEPLSLEIGTKQQPHTRLVSGNLTVPFAFGIPDDIKLKFDSRLDGVTIYASH